MLKNKVKKAKNTKNDKKNDKMGGIYNEKNTNSI